MVGTHENFFRHVVSNSIGTGMRRWNRTWMDVGVDLGSRHRHRLELNFCSRPILRSHRCSSLLLPIFHVASWLPLPLGCPTYLRTRNILAVFLGSFESI